MLKKQQPRFPGLQTPSKRHDLFKDDPSAEGGESSQQSTGGNMAASVQAALQALQAGQLSLNQLSVQLMALGSPWQNQLAALAMKQAAVAASGNSSGPLGASSAPMGVPPHLPPSFPPTELQVKSFCEYSNSNSVCATTFVLTLQAIQQALQHQQQSIQQHLQNLLLIQQSTGAVQPNLGKPADHRPTTPPSLPPGLPPPGPFMGLSPQVSTAK